VLIFGTTREKDLRGMLAPLAGHFDTMIFTRYLGNPRSVPPEELLAIAKEASGQSGRVCPTPAEAWGQASALASPDDLICVTGSFFLAAEMRALCLADQPV
jgi:dihydrofolate synthase/folylpolyglutamate synthase